MTRYVVVVNGAWHPYHWVYDLESAKTEARKFQAAGDDAQVYALVETHYYKRRPSEDAGQSG